MDTAIKFFEKSDGRDKVGKTLQNALKVISYHHKTAGNAARHNSPAFLLQ